MRKTRKGGNSKAKARYAQLAKHNATRIAKCRNAHCITPKIKKYCKSYWARTKKNYRKQKSDKYSDCFLSNASEMKQLGLYEGMPECTQKHGCYKIDKSVEAEMARLEKQMEQS
jgi:hypothetical protein